MSYDKKQVSNHGGNSTHTPIYTIVVVQSHKSMDYFRFDIFTNFSS
jgi:hypothetical protein